MRTPQTDHTKFIRLLEVAERGRYKGITLCGSGGHAFTFRAADSRHNGRPVAIKVGRNDIDGRKQGVESDIVKEGLKTAKLCPHDNIVEIYDFVKYDRDKQGLVMEFVAEGNLSRMIRELIGDVQRSVSIAIGVCRALKRAHEYRDPIVHRDVKPENVLMDGLIPKLTDFGIARESDMMVEAVGALGYMAPESLRGDRHTADPRSDLYSLAVVLFEMLEGHRPFRGDTTTELIRGITSDRVPEFHVDSPVALRRIIRKGLQKNPSHRYQTAAEMLFDLELFLSFYTNVFVVIEKFEGDLGQRCADPQERDRTFLFLGERYLEIAAQTINSVAGETEPGPAQTSLGLRSALLLLVAEEGLQGEELLGRARALCGASAVERSGGSAPSGQTGIPTGRADSGPNMDAEIEALEALLAAGRVADAKARAEAFLAATDHVNAFLALARLFYAKALFTQAVAVCDLGLARHGERADLHAIRGKALYKAEKWQEALKAFGKAGGLNSSDEDARYYYNLLQARAAAGSQS